MAVDTLKLKNNFNIKDEVYHVTSGEKCIITMVRIVVDTTHIPIYQYCVSAGLGVCFWVDELELTNEEPLNID